jgi:hypothetical protein
MFHKSLLKCISNTGADASFIDPGFDLMNATYTLSKKPSSATLSDTAKTSLSRLKKKFNSSNEKLSLHLKSKLKSTMKPRKHHKQKSPPTSDLANASILTFNSSNLMSSTAINATNPRSLYSISVSEFYSENSDESDDDYDSDISLEDTYSEETLRFASNGSFQDASFDSLDSQDDLAERTIAEFNQFNPTISSSRYETTSVCSRCERARGVSRRQSQRRSLGAFLPGQTSSRIVLVSSEEVGPDVSGIYVSRGVDCDDSSYFSFERKMNNTVFSSTMITSL